MAVINFQNNLPDGSWRCIKSKGVQASENATQFLPLPRGESSPKPIARIQPLNCDNDRDSVSLSSPKGGEGWGEEALRAQGKMHWMFDVPEVHGEGEGNSLVRALPKSPVFFPTGNRFSQPLQ